ncbi:MAG: carboxylesterase [Planctomycetota bacterium]|nr:MAG: carboxylesterase [Planctomycetota bacterium]
MAEKLLPSVEIEPARPPAQRSVIWLHGLGADGHDFEPVVPWFRLAPEAGVRFVFPHAPHMPVGINFGVRMPAWYDIHEEGGRMRAEPEGVLRAQEWIRALVARENERGVPSERIVLAGFSQGGSLALHTALRHPERLAGAVGLSCFLVRAGTLEAERSPANAGLPIFLGHGESDPMVPNQYGMEARDTLLALGYPVEWHSYPMAHQVLPEEIVDLGRWLRKRWSQI